MDPIPAGEIETPQADAPKAAAQATSYDELPYEGRICWYAYPDRLAALATLFGMQPPALDCCRVLELGCGTGINLIAIAQDLPGSHCRGIDLSPRQIAYGQEVVASLGLPNVELTALDLLAAGDRLGTFDYIICHGIYSWVPPAVQDQILAVCGRHLAPQGVAYISYNTYPGWHQRGMLRDMMLFHVRRAAQGAPPREQVQQARAFLDFLTESVSGADTTYSRLLREQAVLLKDHSDSYLFHEYLEAANRPVYFYEFVARAAARGLQYVSEAHFAPLPNPPSASAVQALEEMPDLLRREQYLDFLGNRTFRRSLLCRAGVKLQRPPAPEGVLTMYATGLCQPTQELPDVCSTAPQHFRTESHATFTTGIPLVKATLMTLYEALPRALPFESLWAGVSARLAEHPEFLDEGRASLADCLLQCALSGLVEMQVREPTFVTTASARPVASPLARLLAATDQPVPNLRHRHVELGPQVRQVLRHLDGSRDADALAVIFADTARAALDATLEALGYNAFLVS